MSRYTVRTGNAGNGTAAEAVIEDGHWSGEHLLVALGKRASEEIELTAAYFPDRDYAEAEKLAEMIAGEIVEDRAEPEKLKKGAEQ
jgi:hypothetical protein